MDELIEKKTNKTKNTNFSKGKKLDVGKTFVNYIYWKEQKLKE